MTSLPPKPPGFEHRQLPRCVRPDIEKIEGLLWQKQWSEHHLANLCGRGDAGFIRHWRRNCTCYVRTLVRVAEVLGVKNWWELWADYVAPAPASLERSLNECLIEELAVKTLLNPTNELSATGQPLETSNFLEQVIAKFPEETRPLLGNEEAFTRVFQSLELMGGWLIANSDGTFSRRYWTQRECVASIEYRCGAEDGAMLAVANLKKPNREDSGADLAIYEEILDDQWSRLKRMKDYHNRVIRDRDEEAAIQIVKEDDAFHRRWAYAPCTFTSFGFALKTIDQSTNRFIETLKRCKERGIAVPESFPTLPTLVENYYPDLEAILVKFVTVKPNDVEGMVSIRQLLRRHALVGFNTATGAEMLIQRWPRRPCH